MPVSLRGPRTRLLVLLGSVAALALVSTAVASRRATAIPAAQPYTDAIRAEAAFHGYDALASIGLLTWFPGPDNESGPDATPDGQGGFEFFENHYGGTTPGAIYAYTTTPAMAATIRNISGLGPSSPVQARAVTGDILRAWAPYYENGPGYPISRELRMTTLETSWGGPGAAGICQLPGKVQYFQRLDGGLNLACQRDGDAVRWKPLTPPSGPVTRGASPTTRRR